MLPMRSSKPSSILKLKARAELERRRRVRARSTFREWLSLASPELEWDVPHLRALQDKLEQAAAGAIRRLMVFMPPRHGKSEMSTVRFPIWQMQKKPGMNVIVGAYNQNLAAEFSRKARDVASRTLRLDPGRASIHEWGTQDGGVFRAVGVGTGVTGRGAQLIVVDDPVKSRAEANSPAYRDRVWNWYKDDLYTRIEPDGIMILIMTRWHADDLAGRILLSDQADEWEVVRFPAVALGPDDLGRTKGEALWPDRYDTDALARIERVLGDISFAALYQQSPMVEGGSIFRADWWQLAEPDDPDASDRNRINIAAKGYQSRIVARWQFWDTALKDDESNDYSACATFELTTDYRLVLADMWQERIQSAFLANVIEERAISANHDDKLRAIVVEDKGSGTTAIQTLRASAPSWLANSIKEFMPTGTKEYRARKASIWCAGNSVLMPYPGPRSPWHYEFLDAHNGQLFLFPAAAHDDMVDAFSMGIIYLENYLEAGKRARDAARQEEVL